MTRFYGGDAMTWLSQPTAIVRAYAAMLPRLQAEESLRAVQRTAVGTGSMKQSDINSAVRAWRAESSTPNAAPRKPRFDLEALASMGIGIRKVGAKA